MADLRGQPIRATSDLHLTARTAECVFAALKELSEDSCKTGGTTLLVGDIFSQGDTVHMPTWNRLRWALQHWPGQVIVIPGNHDQYDGWRNCLEGLEGGSCRVISQPGWIALGRIMPHTPSDRFVEELEAIKMAPVGEPLVPLIWAHHGFRGAYRNAMSRDGDGVSCSAIPEGHVVVTGHYHMPQNLGPIIYCGSPYETTFAEEGQHKGWLRWEDPFADLIPVRVPYGDIGAPRHYTIRWDPEQGKPSPPPGLRPIDNVRVVTQATRKVALAHAKQLRKAGLAGAALLARPEAGSSRGVIRPGMSPQRAAESWVLANSARYNPEAMDEYARETGLWEAIS